MLATKVLRSLDLAHDAGGPKHLSAASGLVQIGSRLFVVADDENSLGLFDFDRDRKGRLFSLFDGELPRGHKDRKAAKPDFESLAFLPLGTHRPFGALFALGSGSRPNRQLGALVGLDSDGLPNGPVRVVDLTPLFAPLLERFPALNIEGAFVEGSDLCLLQRGNTRSPVNGCIRFSMPGVEGWLHESALAPALATISTLDLGDIDGVPLCLTDGAAVAGGGWVFCATAEDSRDSYGDGRCLGSVVGLVRDARVVAVERLDRLCKAEGISVREGTAGLDLLLVIDGDDRSIPALLLSATLSAN
jgi:hypothetical protein